MNVAKEPNQMYSRRITTLEGAQGLHRLNDHVKEHQKQNNNSVLGSPHQFSAAKIDANSTRNAAFEILKSKGHNTDHPIAKRYARQNSMSVGK